MNKNLGLLIFNVNCPVQSQSPSKHSDAENHNSQENKQTKNNTKTYLFWEIQILLILK